MSERRRRGQPSPGEVRELMIGRESAWLALVTGASEQLIGPATVFLPKLPKRVLREHAEAARHASDLADNAGTLLVYAQRYAEQTGTEPYPAPIAPAIHQEYMSPSAPTIPLPAAVGEVR